MCVCMLYLAGAGLEKDRWPYHDKYEVIMTVLSVQGAALVTLRGVKQQTGAYT